MDEYDVLSMMFKSHRITESQFRIYSTLLKVPKGKVVSYGSLGEAAGLPRGCARAVGQAMRSNPLAPRVPCHRVVGSDGRLGGFKGMGFVQGIFSEKTLDPMLKEKVNLLKEEGVGIDSTGKVAKKFFHLF